MKKYEFTGEEKRINKTILKRIIAIKNFGDVIKGQIGGWIEKEDNLSHFENCWVYDEAMVYGNAQVFGNSKIYGKSKVYGNSKVSDNAWICGQAKIYGNARTYGRTWVYGEAKVYGNSFFYSNAQICGNADIEKTKHVITFINFGKYNDTLTAFKTKTGIQINCGNFLGTLEEFTKNLKKNYKNNKYSKEYEAIIEVIKIRFNIV